MNKNRDIPQYEPISFRGAGAFGYVVEAYDKRSNRRVAIKKSHKVGNKLSREFTILESLRNCSNIIEMINFYYSVNDDGNIIQNIVFEYIPNSLENLIQSCDHFEIKVLKNILYQILNGLSQAHSRGIVHRDLKPDNILLSEELIVKICDWGSSKFIKDGITESSPYIVSRFYRAPELILGETLYNSSIDMFSLGCIIYEMVTLSPLFPSKDDGLLIFEQICVLGIPPRGYLDKYSNGYIVKNALQEYSDFVSNFNMVNNISDMRKYSNEAILDLTDLIMKLICWVPLERLNASEAMSHCFFKKNY